MSRKGRDAAEGGGVAVPDFRKVGTVQQFKEGRGRCVTVEGTRIAVFNRCGRFYAMGDRCAHMGASLAEGKLVGEHVQCSWHGWKYDLTTGRNDMKEWACIPIYEVRVEGNEVYVGLPDPSTGETPGQNQEEWFTWDPDD